LLVVLTDVLAFALVATSAVRAVMIDTALGADARPVIEVVAAEQPVTAIELRAVIGRRDPARAALGTATGVILDALPIAALLALATFAIADAIGAIRAGWAIAVVTAFSAGGAVLGGAANEIGAALHPILARIGFAQGAIVAFAGAAGPDRHTFALAALLTLAAFTVADAARAEAACAAVAVMTAFRAIAALATRAAEEIVAAVPLGAGTVRDRAGFTRIAAAGPVGHTGVLAALLSLGARADTRATRANFAITRAIGIRAAFTAPAPAGRFAAGQIATAEHPGVVTRFTDLEATRSDRGADIVTALLLFRALVVAGSLGANTAVAIVVGAALALRLTGISIGAAIFARVAIADAGSIGACGALAVTIGIAAALIGLAGPADAGLTKLAVVVATAGRAVVIGGTRVAAFLPGFADRSVLAVAIAIAERFAAFVFAFVRTIAVDAALLFADPITAKAVFALIEADAPAALMAGIADLRIAGAGFGIANRARVSTEILVDALSANARQGLAGDRHTVALVWHTGAGLVEPCRDRHTPHQTAKQPLERRAA
jgi:hypothetical protein